MNKDPVIETTGTLLETKPLGWVTRISDASSEYYTRFRRLFNPLYGHGVILVQTPEDLKATEDLGFPHEFARRLTEIYADKPDKRRKLRR